jgi:N-acetylglucosaminyl-diphospho-decaprenol L-rhamnosyltransferase
MDLCVVVVTFNSAACIGSCLTSVREHLPAAEIVVVDNASQDETAELVLDAGAQLIRNRRNEGFGRAANRGAGDASQGHVLFLNPDVSVTHCDGAALDELLQAERLGLVGPRPTTTSGLIGPQPEPSLGHEWLEQTVGTLRPRELQGRTRSPSRAEGCDWVSGSMLLVRRGEFLRLGGFDRRFFLYYEDRDLAARYRRERLPIRGTAAIAGAHVQGASSGADDVRIVPAGWAFFGWIEYVFLHRGERTARRTARSALAALKSVRAGVAAVANVSGAGRWARKRQQLDGLVGFLAGKAAEPSDEDSFCPDARRLVAEILG